MKYWSGCDYLGLGPSAHSYNGKARHWNPSSLSVYLNGYKKGQMKDLTEHELLSGIDRANEYLITRLRTIWGVDKLEWNELNCGVSWNDLIQKCEKYRQAGKMVVVDNKLKINQKSWFVADGIITDLFLLSEI